MTEASPEEENKVGGSKLQPDSPLSGERWTEGEDDVLELATLEKDVKHLEEYANKICQRLIKKGEMRIVPGGEIDSNFVDVNSKSQRSMGKLNFGRNRTARSPPHSIGMSCRPPATPRSNSTNGKSQFGRASAELSRASSAVRGSLEEANRKVHEILAEQTGDSKEGKRLFSVLVAWFLITATVALIAVILTTNEFLTTKNPGVLAIERHSSESLPVATICPIDFGIPAFNTSADISQVNTLGISSLQLIDGTECRSEDCKDTFIEGGWLTSDPSLDCSEVYGKLSVNTFSNLSLIGVPCKYCFRIGKKGNPSREANGVYTHQTERIRMQLSVEFLECTRNPGGLSSASLGTGDLPGSMNYYAKRLWRRYLQDLGIIEFEEGAIGSGDNADFDSQTMCNILFFSGAFLPSDEQSDIRYTWNPNSRVWNELGAGPYFQVRKEFTTFVAGGFEIFFQDRSSVLEFDELQALVKKRGLINGQRFIRAPSVIVGGSQTTTVVLVAQTIKGEPHFSWDALSYQSETTPEYDYSAIIEYGFKELYTQSIFYKKSDPWSWLENCLGWVGSFTGLSLFALIKRPLLKRVRDSFDERDRVVEARTDAIRTLVLPATQTPRSPDSEGRNGASGSMQTRSQDRATRNESLYAARIQLNPF